MSSQDSALALALEQRRVLAVKRVSEGCQQKTWPLFLACIR
jgi:hypothetical protein